MVPNIDFGSTAPGAPQQKIFEISNFSQVTMRGLKVVKSGPGAASWTLSPLPKTSLKPGEKIQVVASFSATAPGYKTAYLTFCAKGKAFKPIRIPVLAFVGATAAAPNISASARASRTPAKAQASAPAPIAAAPPAASSASSAAHQSTAPSDVWVAASIDGFFRHEFRRPTALKTTPSFWISTDGLSWQESFPLSVKFLRNKQNFFEYEATLSPPNAKDLIISVSETIPSSTKP
jgi:hypothetical protein